MNGKPETVIDGDANHHRALTTPQKSATPLLDRLPQRWGLIAGLVGGSIALATTVTVVTNVIVRRRTATSRVVGFRPVRRYGVRRVKTPRGGSAWVAYLYRTPDLRMRLPIRK